MQGAAKWVTIIGLILTLLGAASATYGVWLSPDETVEAGVSRWSGGKREELLQLPAVQNLLQQSHFALAGFILIGFGTLLQIVGVALQDYQQDYETAFSIQRKQLRAALSLNRITFWSAILALGGLVVLFFTLRDNRRAMIDDHRAWIAGRTPIFHIAPPPKNPGDLFQIAVSYENIGKEPALNVSKAQGPFWITDFALLSNIYELNFPPNDTCFQVNTKINMGPTWPGAKPDVSRGPAFQIIADDAFLNMKKLLGYHGCFIYETFQESHRTGYCFLLIPVVAHPVAEWLWEKCPGADQNFAD
jgi:hypothetical protein